MSDLHDGGLCHASDRGASRFPRIARVLALALPLSALVAACGGGGDVTRSELDSMRSEMLKLRAENAALGERLDAVELRSGAARKGDAPTSDRPSLDVVRLTPEGASSDDPDAETARPVVRATGAGGTVVEEKGKGGGSAQRDFDEAVELYRAKKYDKALEAFTTYAARYPDGANTADAGFLRAECYVAKGDSRRAVEQFEATVARFPKAAKAPDALLKVIQIQGRLGNRAAADDAKKKLLTDYPTSDAAKKLAKP